MLSFSLFPTVRVSLPWYSCLFCILLASFVTWLLAPLSMYQAGYWTLRTQSVGVDSCCVNLVMLPYNSCQTCKNKLLQYVQFCHILEQRSIISTMFIAPSSKSSSSSVVVSKSTSRVVLILVLVAGIVTLHIMSCWVAKIDCSYACIQLLKSPFVTQKF